MSIYRNTITVNSDTVLVSTDKNIKVDVTANPVIITLPLVGSDVDVNDVVKIAHTNGDASINNINIISNPSDTSVIFGGDILIDINNSVTILELTDNNTWINSTQIIPIGMQKVVSNITSVSSVINNINHNLNTLDVSVDILDSNNIKVGGAISIVDSNNITVTLSTNGVFKVVIIG